MGKPSKSKRSESFGKGKVTPMQVAFLVDRYLCDNRFSETRNVFRSEASSLISKSPVREVPKGLLSLEDIVGEYICLKGQKMALDMEREKLEQEKTRVQNLLQGMQNVMNTYNASAAAPPPAILAASSPSVPVESPAVNQSSVVTPLQNVYRGSPSGIQYNKPNAMPVTLLGNKRIDCGNFSTPSTGHSITRKRKSLQCSSGAPPISRKTRNKTVPHNTAMAGMNQIREVGDKVGGEEAETMMNNNGCSSSVAKCLFDKGTVKTSSPPMHQQVTMAPSNCTVITKERITLSPMKQITSYTVETSHHHHHQHQQQQEQYVVASSSSSSPSKSCKRDTVKGKLNFDDSETSLSSDITATAAAAALELPPIATTATDGASTSPSESEHETDDIFNMDFPNMDLLGESFSFSELLVDFDLGCDGALDLIQTSNLPMEAVSGSSPEGNGNGNVEYTSTITEVIQGNDLISTQGSNAVKSVTKCLRILSPVKNSRQKNQESTDN